MQICRKLLLLLPSNAEGNVWEQLVQKNTVPCSSTMGRHCCFGTVGMFDKNLSFAKDCDVGIRLATHYYFALIKEPLIGILAF